MTKGKNEFWLELEAPKVHSSEMNGLTVGFVRYRGSYDGSNVSRFGVRYERHRCFL
jgi:hypothetical protein